MTERLLIEVAPHRRLAVQLQTGEGPVVLLAHGVGSSANFVVEAFGGPLREAGLRLAAIDLRGHADSDPAPDPVDHLLQTHADDLKVVADVVGAELVGGVSLGGMAAVRAVADGLVVRAVVAVIPGWSGRAVAGEGPHAAVADEVRRVGVDGMLARLRNDSGLPAWIREVVLRDYERHDRASLTAALLALDGGEGPTVDEIASITCPLAVVGWPDDPGHPLGVAQAWAVAAGTAILTTTSISAMQVDRSAFGVGAVQALRGLTLVAP